MIGIKWLIDLLILMLVEHLIKVTLPHHFEEFMHSALKSVQKSGSILIFSWKLSLLFYSLSLRHESITDGEDKSTVSLVIGNSNWFDNWKEMWTETKLPGSTVKMNDMMYSSMVRVCINSMLVTRSAYKHQHPKRSRELKLVPVVQYYHWERFHELSPYDWNHQWKSSLATNNSLRQAWKHHVAVAMIKWLSLSDTKS